MKPSAELLAYFKGGSDQIQAYAQILKTTGIERGLIGPKEGDRIWQRHIANCLPITTLIPQGVRVADIGSGAGLPGIVIALARPDLKVTLIEPLQRRVDFLNEVISELHLPVEVIRGRAEIVKKQFEVVTARAVAPLEKLMQISWQMIPRGGCLLAIKGEQAGVEMSSTKLKKGATAKLHQISLPNLPVARVVCITKGA
ncbi:16S rRNA (guanine527-N7)-methyltransferase [Candidatus Nanopelagicus hibericus]|uniref:Ribosomal RNA small subunit methyltransferase G n=1 Tax=Candidatus Nanopelagicus hibericus TaxID=1884915 RepID=A0A249KAP8_9ACTN|nr:16S rRNA (guanine(527)-N(7))-methyltransferase RsmG [Candidatus Nanopelagicus hibericus]ASY13883.1 16S rRNA (guanine527-N7)-methyltransferase [Candidatus Nanopelagicus hibericus]